MNAVSIFDLIIENPWTGGRLASELERAQYAPWITTPKSHPKIGVWIIVIHETA